MFGCLLVPLYKFITSSVYCNNTEAVTYITCYWSPICQFVNIEKGTTEYLKLTAANITIEW